MVGWGVERLYHRKQARGGVAEIRVHRRHQIKTVAQRPLEPGDRCRP